VNSSRIGREKRVWDGGIPPFFSAGQIGVFSSSLLLQSKGLCGSSGNGWVEVQEWNELPEKVLWCLVALYTMGSGVGRFGAIWGYMGDSGWGRGVVERVRGAQEVPWSARNRGVSCCKVFLIIAQDWHGSSPPLFQTLKDKKEGCCYSIRSTRGRDDCWKCQWDGLVGFQINFH
jgi:hypothetical protein